MRPFRFGLGALGALMIILAVDCSKSKDTLVISALTADPAAPGLTSAVVTIGTIQKTFPLPNGLTATPASFGVYVPSSVVGAIDVSVSATGGGLCYHGETSTTIVSAGMQVDVTIPLAPTASCTGAGGSGGVGGSGGAVGGSGGAVGGSGGAVGGSGGSVGGTGGTSVGGMSGGGTGGGGTNGGGTGGGNAGGGGAGGAAGAGGTVPTLSWSPATNIEMDPLTASYWPTIAISPMHGDVLVAWTKGDNPAVKRWDATKKAWGMTTMLDNRGSVQNVTVAMDDLGHALVVWNQILANSPPPELQGVWFSHSEDGGATWSPAARIHDGQAQVTVTLGMAADGSARAAWEETDGTQNSVWSATYSPTAKTFSGAAMVKLGSDIYERYARIVVSKSGPGLLVWIQRDAGDNDSVWGSSFAAPGGALTTPVLIDSNMTSDVYDANVAISADGTHGIVGWDQAPATADEIWTADWTTAGFAAGKKDFSGDGVAAPGMAIDASYNVTMAWSQMLASGKWNVTAARRTSMGAWGEAMALETTNQAGSFTDEYAYPSVASDAAGNVHVLWRRKIDAGNTYGVVVRRWSAAAWQPEVVLGTKTGLSASQEQLAVAADGRAAASFYYDDPDATGDSDAYNVFVAFFK